MRHGFAQRGIDADLPASLAAKAFDTDRDSCLQSGMNDILSKPFRMDALRDKLQKSVRAYEPALVPET